MKRVLLLLIWGNLNAQRPVIYEQCDTIIYHANNKTYAIYKFKDGSAWVQDKNSVEYLSRRKYKKWKRKHVKF
jgi:hypothetical protein